MRVLACLDSREVFSMLQEQTEQHPENVTLILQYPVTDQAAELVTNLLRKSFEDLITTDKLMN